MDLLIVKNIANKYLTTGSRRERYTDGTDATTTASSTAQSVSMTSSGPSRVEVKAAKVAAGVAVAFMVLWFIVWGIPAAYLSWWSNTQIGWHPAMKVLFAFFAFFNGLWFLISFLIHKLDMVMYIRSGCRSGSTPRESAPPSSSSS
jgi:hypothetical protein